MILFIFFLSLLPDIALAHVKWFSNYDFQHAPLTLSQLSSPYFWSLFALSIISLPLLVWADRLGEKWGPTQRVNAFLNQYSRKGPLIMRVTMGAVLLMSWQGDSVIAPEIPIPSPLWGWLQFLLACFLLFKQTSIITGLGMIVLWLKGINDQGMFHMLDYVIYPAVGLYLILAHVKKERFKNLDLPVLYSGLGFSLCWVAFEKFIYPYWGLSVFEQAPGITLGLDPEFFLLACAFVEFTLGYLLIICLLQRPLAVVITLVFFTTTVFFGKTEVVGHTILHGALLVFIVKGPGIYYQAPIRFHKRIRTRTLFAMGNFVILFYVLAFAYEKMANAAHKKSLVERAELAHPRLELSPTTPTPEIMVHAKKDSMGGWNLHLMTKNFRFSPEKAGAEHVPGEGHAHLYVNEKKVARVYDDWFHISLVKGVNKIKVTLNSNDHKDLYVNGKPVAFVLELNEEREVKGHQHQH